MIRPDDMVRIGSDLHALVLRTSRQGMTRGHLEVRPICGAHGRASRDIRTSEVTRHWKLSRSR